jgi:hypothetical protein
MAPNQRSDVAHEDLRRIAVEPEKPQARATSAPQKIVIPRALTSGIFTGGDEVAGQVGEDRERAAGHDDGPDGCPSARPGSLLEALTMMSSANGTEPAESTIQP